MRMFRKAAAFLRTAVPVALVVTAVGGALSQEDKYDTFIPYVPTPDHVVERMLELAEVGPDDYVFDLGSGDGRIVITAAKKFGARALGVEIDPRLVDEARRNATAAGVADRTTFLVQDLFVAPIRDATVITLYVLTETNLALRSRLLEELRPGSRVVSHAFSMGGWLADRHENFRGADLYLWIVPADVAGTWQVTDGVREFIVSFQQTFQEIKGEATVGGRTSSLRNAKLRGDRLEFTVAFGAGEPVPYRGKVSGDRIDATGAGNKEYRHWRARRVSGASSLAHDRGGTAP
jgi:SAM-dependent methyltransferase